MVHAYTATVLASHILTHTQARAFIVQQDFDIFCHILNVSSSNDSASRCRAICSNSGERQQLLSGIETTYFDPFDFFQRSITASDIPFQKENPWINCRESVFEIN